MILVCNNPAAAEQVLDALPITEDPVREQRLKRMQGKQSLNREQLLQSEKWQRISTLLNTL